MALKNRVLLLWNKYEKDINNVMDRYYPIMDMHYFIGSVKYI